MKKIVLLLLLVMPLMTMAQTKIKETQVPKSVLNALDRKYDSYKVKTWYRSPGQYVAEFVYDGQNGRAYFTHNGDWQYSTFPTKQEDCPTAMNRYFVDNYPGYRIRSIDYVEQMDPALYEWLSRTAGYDDFLLTHSRFQQDLTAAVTLLENR